MTASNTSPPHRLVRLSPLTRYGAAIGIAAIGVAARLALDPAWGDKFPYITLFPAVMLSAWLGGFWPGVLTTALTALAATFYWIEPRGSLADADTGQLAGLAVFVAIGAIISVLNESWRRGVSAVLDSEGRLSVTLASIGDGVITTDGRGYVTRLNAVAERLTGWTAADALGRPLHEIFVVVNEDSAQPAPNPVYRVIHEGITSGLANPVLLIAKDGRQIPIDDSAAPIRTADGRPAGVIMVFRDVSERRRVERERAALLEHEREAHATADRAADELRRLQIITDVTLAGTDTNTMVRDLLYWVRAAMASDSASILLADSTGAFLTPVASVGLEEELDSGIRIPIGRGVAGRIAGSQTATIIHDLADTESVSPVLRRRLASLIGVSLRIGDRLLGVLHAGTTARRHFTDADVRVLSLAGERVALALERARLHDADRAARRDAEIAAEQLRVALDAGQMGTWEFGMRTGIVKWSPGLEAIHGRAPGSFPGTFDAFRDEIHPADRDRVVNAIAEAVERRQDHHIEYRIVRQDGSVRWVEGRGRLFLDDGGQPDRMVGVCSDITDRKRADERFRLAVDAAPAAMILVDGHGTIVLTNRLTETLLGYTKDELVGRHIDTLVPDRFRERHSEHRRRFLGDARARPMGAGRDLHALRKDGSEVPVEIGLSPIETADGVLVLAAVTDISERNAIEVQRAELLLQEQQARAELERANRAKDEFLAMLSHELRTPLNAVLGYANLLSSGQLPPERSAHALEAIHRNVRAQARLVDSLLELSRIAAGKLEFQLEPLDLVRTLDKSVDVIRPEAQTKGISLHVECPSGPVRVVGDAFRLEQVFWNLLSNAVKFTPAGGTVHASVSGQGESAAIRITDTGRGISRDFLPRVFERFSQADRASGQAPGGLGLGLALARELVQAHGGAIVAESSGEGRGSTFTVSLPLAPADPGSTVGSSSTRMEAEGPAND